MVITRVSANIGFVILRELGYLITDFKIVWEKHTLIFKHKCFLSLTFNLVA